MEIEEFNKHIIPMRSKLLDIASRANGIDCTAEDLVQETMLRLWSMRHQLDKNTNSMALATTIIKNIERDHWRHRQHEREEKPDRKEIPTQDNRVEARSDIELIRRITEKLPPLQSQIFRMKEIEGYDKKEIMQITGCTETSLRQNLSRARKRIREEFIKMTR